MSADHPEQQEWMEWLYGESDPTMGQLLSAHLEQCADCRKQVSEWRRVMTALDADIAEGPVSSAREASQHQPLLTRREPAGRFAPRQLLVLAASVVLAALGGAWSVVLFQGVPVSEQRTLGELKSELQWFIRDELARAEASEEQLLPLIQDTSGRIVAAELADWAQQDSQRTLQLRQVLREVLRNQRALREDLETLAMEAEAQILQTQRELVRVSVDAGIRNGTSLPVGPDVEQF